MATKMTTTTEDWTLPDLRTEAEDLRKRLNRFRTSLSRFFVAKQELIDKCKPKPGVGGHDNPTYAAMIRMPATKPPCRLVHRIINSGRPAAVA